MRWVLFLLSLLLTIGLTIGCLTVVDPLPTSLGLLLDPFHGLWANAQQADAEISPEISHSDLQSSVTVIVDERHVPHVFAQNDHDLYWTQGYLAAKDRLWQMDFQTRAAAGRLSEILGPGPDDALIAYDQGRRRKGIVYAAERRLTMMMAQDTTRQIVEAYSDGVNAYIASLSPDEYPIEYKLLGYTPERWSPFKSALFSVYISDDLSGGADDLSHTLAIHAFGRAIAERLYPLYPYAQSPTVPADQPWLRTRDLPTAVPPTPADYAPDSLMTLGTPQAGDRYHKGSNGWAVHGSRTASGLPILANDMHLGLNLPAIWYEIQLQAPGINVYGVSFPGAPCVIVGFNDSIAWGATSGAQDVIDYYTVTFRDEQRQEYWYDGQWLRITPQYDTVYIKGRDPLVDTILYTHQGPIRYDEKVGDYGQPLAMRWIAHDPSNVLQTYYLLNRADNYQDYERAIRHHHSPVINFPFAAVNGDIAIWHAGRLPLRWPGQGRYLLDGSRQDHRWNGDIPWSELPHLYNPAQGFVQSANQQPTDPTYPYPYLGNFEDYRGRRLNDLLASQDSLSVQDIQRMQLDSYGQFAADILPLLLADLDTLQLSSKGRQAFDSLRAWDYRHHHQQTGPTLYQAWWEQLNRSIWRDELLATGLPLRYPDRSTTIGLLQDSVQFSFYRRPGDSIPPMRSVLVKASFDSMVLELSEDPSEWRWNSVHRANVRHLTRVLSPFSRSDLIVDGAKGVLNATSPTWGPSWRMVVEMSSPPQAYGIYPGGQHGHPASTAYDSFVEDWRNGLYYPLWFMRGKGDQTRPVLQQAVFQPAGS